MEQIAAGARQRQAKSRAVVETASVFRLGHDDGAPAEAAALRRAAKSLQAPEFEAA